MPYMHPSSLTTWIPPSMIRKTSLQIGGGIHGASWNQHHHGILDWFSSVSGCILGGYCPCDSCCMRAVLIRNVGVDTVNFALCVISLRPVRTMKSTCYSRCNLSVERTAAFYGPVHRAIVHDLDFRWHTGVTDDLYRVFPRSVALASFPPPAFNSELLTSHVFTMAVDLGL